MRRSTSRFLPVLFVASFFAVISSAQQPSPYVVGSTVSGHVFCSDSNAPARFAKILLKSTEPNHAGDDFLKSIQDNIAKMAAKDGTPATPPPPPSDEQKRAMANAQKAMNQATDLMNSSTVGLDGAFSFAGIKPGTYYVHAILAGYIDPFAQLGDEDFTSTDPAVKARVAQIPTITVNGSEAVRVDLRLERGAAIGGRVLFDDGSPAAGWTLSVMKKEDQESPEDASAAMMAQALSLSGGASVPKTDDQGNYRISGLLAGKYTVRATLNATAVGISATNIGDGGSGIQLSAFYGNTFLRTEAKFISVAAGEEASGADITIPAHQLHNISGHVFAQTDGHALNVGQVRLTSQSNAALNLTAAIRDDGSFHFDYLPGGVTYTLKVEDAADGENKPSDKTFMGMNLPNPEILRKYGASSTDVLLGDADIDSVRFSVELLDWKPSPKKVGSEQNPADLINSLVNAGSSNKQ